MKGDVQSDRFAVSRETNLLLRDFCASNKESKGEISEYKALEPTYSRDIPDSLLAEKFTEFYSSEADDFDDV